MFTTKSKYYIFIYYFSRLPIDCALLSSSLIFTNKQRYTDFPFYLIDIFRKIFNFLKTVCVSAWQTWEIFSHNVVYSNVSCSVKSHYKSNGISSHHILLCAFFSFHLLSDTSRKERKKKLWKQSYSFIWSFLGYYFCFFIRKQFFLVFLFFALPHLDSQ